MFTEEATASWQARKTTNAFCASADEHKRLVG